MAKRSVSLVPTMGALHDGHLSLVSAAKKKSKIVVVSIFVNPIQFGPAEDYKRYPRDLKKDLQLLKAYEPIVVFSPDAKEMYGTDFRSFVEVSGLGEKLCGRSRPGHFRGVTTVVAKLFNIVKPDYAFFGEKDYQQQLIIKKMVKDLNFDTQIITIPTVRESDGLAKSSRNKYLSKDERKSAPVLYRSLIEAKTMIQAGEKDPQKIIKEIKRLLSGEAPIEIEYISIVDPENLEDIKKIKGKVLIALAARVGKTRLIDNITASAK